MTLATVVNLSVAFLPVTDCAAVPAKVEALAAAVSARWQIGRMRDELTNGIVLKLYAGADVDAVARWAVRECLLSGRAYRGAVVADR